MLPVYITQDMKNPRHNHYTFNKSLFTGNHWKVFNYDEQEKKLHKFEYLCYGILDTAVKVQSNLIWSEKPDINFENTDLQKEWDQLREDTNFDYLMQEITNYSIVFGDQPVKIAVDDNTETADKNDLELKIYLQSPTIWYPDYDKSNPMKRAKTDTLLFKRNIEDIGTKEGEAFLLESHIPGQIIWTAFYKSNGSKEAEQVPLLRYFSDSLDGVVADDEVNDETLEVVYSTGCRYSLIQVLKNKMDIDSYYGVSDFSLPVVSKLNALNNYANLADVIIVTNSFPKLILSQTAGNILKRIVEEFNKGATTNVDNSNPGDLTQDPDKNGQQFLNNKTYAESFIYRKLVDEMKAYVDGADGGNTRYLKNDFSLDEIRKQHDIFFRSIMSELSISEVFYNPELSTGAQSGVAYKRLMTTTLNAVGVKKRVLSTFIKKVVFTMLQLAKNNGLISSEPEMPAVIFKDGLVDDEGEKLANLVTKVQNNFMPLVEAVKIVNDIDENQAREIIEDMDLFLQPTNMVQAQKNVQELPQLENQSQSPSKSVLTEDIANGVTTQRNAQRIRERIVNSVRNGNNQSTNT